MTQRVMIQWMVPDDLLTELSGPDGHRYTPEPVRGAERRMASSMTETVVADPWGVVPQRLHPPRRRSEMLERTSLIERLVAADAAMVTIQAGAGYGKTTLAGQWVDADPRPTGWLTLAVADNDPVVLLRHLVRALAAGGVDTSCIEDLLRSREPRIDSEVLPALASALDRCDRPFLLVLDDVHLIDRGDALRSLDELAERIPNGSTLALAGRSLPPLRLARRQLGGDLLKLDQDDLAYTLDDARAVAVGLDQMPRAVVDELVRCTGGWPAGLYLGVMALAEHPDPPLVLRGLLAADQRVAEYLHEEVLDRMPPEWRAFLLQASVLERLSGPLCDAVLERDDSTEVLTSLSASGNLFVISLDDRGAFRLHDLFAELLLAELRRTDPTAEGPLRRRAATWHHEHGQMDAAVCQALASGDRAFAAAMLYRQLFAVMVRGEIGTLRRWIEGFSSAEVRSNGLVALSAGWLALSLGERGALEMHVGDARAAYHEGVLPDGTVSYEVGLAALEMTASLGGLAEVAEHAALVRAAGPTGSPWSGMSALFEAVARGYSGRSDLVEELERAELESRGMPAVHAVTLAQLGVARSRRGDRRGGPAEIIRAVEEAREHGLQTYSLAAFVHCAHSYAAALTGDDGASLTAAARGGSLRSDMVHVVPRAQIHTGLLLCEAALLRRDVTTASRELESVQALLPAEPDGVVFIEWAQELEARCGRLRSRDTTVELTAAESRVLAQLPTHRSLIEIGEFLYVSRNTVKTHAMSIYRKLGVSGRSEAVARADELGLLEDPTGPR